jgi:polysaccharide export outer membrane protein
MRSRITLLISCFAVTLASAQQSESLLIRAGDLVHVNVLEAPELDQRIRVSDAGEVSLLLGGSIKIDGLTPSAAERIAEDALISGHFILHPHVSVLVEQNTTQNVTVIGQVKAPGSYPISTPRTVLDVLALAGGLNDVADRHLVIEHRDTGLKTSFFFSNDPNAAMSQTITINPGDTVYIPHAEIVYVLGDVNRPGGFAKTTNDSKLTVLQTIALAGATPSSAVPSRARLIRKTADGGYVNLPLPLSDMQKGKKPDIPLQSDDIIYVPFSYIRSAASNIGGILASAAGAAIYQF